LGNASNPYNRPGKIMRLNQSRVGMESVKMDLGNIRKVAFRDILG
jgi:hypothetical protein